MGLPLSTTHECTAPSRATNQVVNRHALPFYETSDVEACPSSLSMLISTCAPELRTRGYFCEHLTTHTPSVSLPLVFSWCSELSRSSFLEGEQWAGGTLGFKASRIF